KEGLESFDARVDSEIFSVFTYDASNIKMSAGLMDDSCIQKKAGDCLDRATYIIKCTDVHFENVHEAMKKDHKETIEKILKSPNVLQYFNEHSEYKPENLISIVIDAIGKDALGQFVSIKNLKPQLGVKEREAIINKHQNIYPTLN
ncbi:MAG: hypothetical protein HDT21_10310, partial [Ruminococcus sp.]|nr:hypothetical protein [Ruminococcus sp.]